MPEREKVCQKFIHQMNERNVKLVLIHLSSFAGVRNQTNHSIQSNHGAIKIAKMDTYESILLIKQEVFIYKIPPAGSNRRHR